jgi:hypothetical protein
VRIIIFGDSKGKDKGINRKVLEKILKQIKKLDAQPEHIIHLGDSVAGSADIEILKLQLDELHRLINCYFKSNILLPTVGNHEVNNNPTDSTAEKVFENYYCHLKVDGYLEGYHKTVYYKDFPSVRCIFLNAFHYGEIHKITGEQLEWFRSVAKEDRKLKIVFVHSPAYPTGAHFKTCLDSHPEYRDEFWKVVDETNITLVVSSHEHNYSRRVIDSNFHNPNSPYNNSITQIISGGAGEKLRGKYKDKRGVIVSPKDVYHYVILDIEDYCIKVKAVSIEGKVLDEFYIG